MPFSLNTHKFKRGPGNKRILDKVIPYKAFTNGPERLYAQDGGVYSEGGQLIEDPPAWFWTAYGFTSDEKKALLKIKDEADYRKRIAKAKAA